MFLVTVFVVDDLVALVVIAVVYSEDIGSMPLLVAAALFAARCWCGPARRAQRSLYVPFGRGDLGARCWPAASTRSCPGLAMGLAAAAYTPARGDLEQASGLFRPFREQPTPELARFARRRA